MQSTATMHSMSHRMAPVRTTHAHAHRGPPPHGQASDACTAFSEHAQDAARCIPIPPQAAAHLPQTPGPLIFPRPLDRWSGVLWMETILPVRRHGHRGSVQQTCEPAAVGRPPLQCWPGHAECPWREEILPVNIARGARRHPPPLTAHAQGVMRIPASHVHTGKIVSINRPAVSLRSTGRGMGRAV